MGCKWVRHFGDYFFTTDCGMTQGINVRPKQKVCMCGKHIERYVQSMSGEYKPVTKVEVTKGIAYYRTY